MTPFALVKQADAFLRAGGFAYAIGGGQAIDLFLGYESRVHGDIDVIAFWDERDRIIQFMWEHGFHVCEMLGGGRVHHITDLARQRYVKRNLCCFRDGCPLVKAYPPDEDGCGRFEFFHTGQTELDFIEFLFNDKSATHFIYARDREIQRALDKAVLDADGVPYLAPELCLLYKSTDTEREGYQQDFELASAVLDGEQRAWLQRALERCYPHEHKWLAAL